MLAPATASALRPLGRQPGRRGARARDRFQLEVEPRQVLGKRPGQGFVVVDVETTGTEAEVDALIALFRGFGIKELVRTGTVVMSRGAGSIQEAVKR